MESEELRVDPDRQKEFEFSGTGILVRAKDSDGKWGSFDIVHLDKESLLSWLKSRGGDNRYAEDVVGILLGHGHLHEHG